MASRETENNAYAKFWGDKQRVLWYVMVFSGGVNSDPSTVFLKLTFDKEQQAKIHRQCWKEGLEGQVLRKVRYGKKERIYGSSRDFTDVCTGG